MDQAILRQALEEIRAIADSALKGSVLRQKETKQSSIKASSKVSQPESLTDHVLKLRDDKFFVQPKTWNEVHEKLQSSYPCDVDRVKVACFRLQKRKLLRKASKLIGTKSQVAYVW